MGRRVLRRHIWGYSVCLCPIKGALGLNELNALDVHHSWVFKANSDDYAISVNTCMLGRALAVQSVGLFAYGTHSATSLLIHSFVLTSHLATATKFVNSFKPGVPFERHRQTV